VAHEVGTIGKDQGVGLAQACSDQQLNGSGEVGAADESSEVVEIAAVSGDGGGGQAVEERPDELVRRKG